MTFETLSEYFQTLEQTRSRIAITEILSKLFHHSSPNEIGQICYLLQGRVAPQYDSSEFGLAHKLMVRVIARICHMEEADIEKDFQKTGDLGNTIQAHRRRTITSNKETGTMTISRVFHMLQEVTKMTGTGSQERKIIHLTDMISQCSPLSSKYIVRILLDKLRLGFSDMTILDGLSWMVKGDKTHRRDLENAYNVRPDIGYIAELFKLHGLKGVHTIQATTGVPVLPCLCQRLPSPSEMITKMGTVAVEPKYDGTRVQIHYRKSEAGNHGNVKTHDSVLSFSRNLENTTDMFPELADIGHCLQADSVILDSEAVGIDPLTGRLLPFQETITRKRKHNVSLFSQSMPLKFILFDILSKDGHNLLSFPLSKRRAILEDTVKTNSRFILSPQIVTSVGNDIRSYHETQIKQGLEGVIVKKWEGHYTPGRRDFTWVKFKEKEGKTGKLADTVDTVIMGYYFGEGKRTEFGIGALLVGIKKGDTFVTVTKIGTGVRDEQWKELKKLLAPYEKKDMPKQYEEVPKTLRPDVWITPSVVVEIAGDDLTKSPLHQAGYALRFPRLVKIRSDKKPQQTTSVDEIRTMYKMQNCTES